MPTDVIMPQMGESIFEGTITKWLKKVGDAVEKDEPLFEISTDKVDAEIPSPVAGVLAAINTPEGATVQVNTIVAVIGEAGAATTPSKSPPHRRRSKGLPHCKCPHRRCLPAPPQILSKGLPHRRRRRWWSSCRSWANPSSRAPSPNGSRSLATRSERRAAARNLHRQSRRRNSVARKRHPHRDPRP